jgi:hypothetical protein
VGEERKGERRKIKDKEKRGAGFCLEKKTKLKITLTFSEFSCRLVDKLN